MTISGIYDCVTKSPMGDQSTVLTVEVEGDTITGAEEGPFGTSQLLDGRIDGDRLTWRTELSRPLPITLTTEARVTGGDLQGKVSAGAFGSFEIRGAKRA